MNNLLAPAALVFAVAGASIMAAAPSRAISLLPGEKWWGGRVVDSSAMPYGASAPVERTLLAIDPESNQAQPLLISSAGRYVWNDEPFAFRFADGKLRLSDAAAAWQIGSGGATLAEAFRAASKKFFPPSGRLPAPLLFTTPQFNTWIELLYDQRQDRILKYARTLVAQGYPPGVLMIDDNWQEAYGTWRFSARRFPDPKAMMQELHALGFKVMVWVCPFVSPDTVNYRALEKRGLLLQEEITVAPAAPFAAKRRPAIIRWWNGASGVLDLSHPEARAWFKGELDQLVQEWGVDGFKFDAGDSPFYVPEPVGVRYVSHAPRTPEGHTEDFTRVGLDFPFNEYRACWKLAGQPLAQRLRDKDHTWVALRDLIPGIIAQGLMGHAFTCPDLIGGGWSAAFEDPNKFDPELLVRSSQVHALMPMMQFSVAPWRVLKPELAALCLEAAKLHQKFGPRILALAQRSAQSGEPIVKPLAWAWPGRNYEDIEDQFMLGDDLLVAPVVTKGSRSRSVIFPPGRWQGDDGTIVDGPVERDVATPLSRIPHFILLR
jgi:alpha-glucosidase (family GH31 glycosyl hydrolase)